MEHSTAHVADPAVKHKVIHEVSIAVEGLCSNPRWTPRQETTGGYRKPVLTFILILCNKHQEWFLYLITSLRESSGMYFCRFLTCAPMKSPLYISPTPYVMFLIISFWRPLQVKKQNTNRHHTLCSCYTVTEIVTFSRTNLLPERERIGKVLSIEVVHFVTLPFKGEDSVGAEPNTSIHPRGKMNSEERKTRVRNLMRDFTEFIRKNRHFKPTTGI